MGLPSNINALWVGIEAFGKPPAAGEANHPGAAWRPCTRKPFALQACEMLLPRPHERQSQAGPLSAILAPLRPRVAPARAAREVASARALRKLARISHAVARWLRMRAGHS